MLKIMEMSTLGNCVRQQENQPLRSEAVVYGPTRSDFRKKWLKPLSIVMKNFGKKKSCRCLQNFWFCSHFLQTDDFSTNCWKTFKYSKKESRFFYMAGREVEIHRGRLDKKILADRAQLFPRFLSKKIFKNFKNFRKTFSFFWIGNLNFFEKSRLFSFSKEKSRVIFEGSKTKKVEIFLRFFKKFQVFHPKKWKCFSKFFKIFINLFW